MNVPARIVLVWLALAAILVADLACQSLRPPPLPPETTTSGPAWSLTTIAAASPALPLFKQVAITSVNGQEGGKPFDYSIRTSMPQLSGSLDPRVAAFNQDMNGVVSRAVSEFKASLLAMPESPAGAASGTSSFNVSYELVSPPGRLLSIKFEMSGYIAGAAHPYSVSRTKNFDLDHGRDLELGDIFQAGSGYLAAISRFCIAQLEGRNIAFDATNAGAAPTLENYRNWNLRADGLMITFDEYQVAAYAAGPQLVLIPYSVLAPLIQSPGPLDSYLHQPQ